MDKLQIAPEEGIDVFKNEVGILEINKYSKVCKDGKTQYELCTAPVCVDQHCSAIVDGDGKKHDQQIPGFPPGVEEQTCHEQHSVAVSRAQKVIGSKNHGQKNKNKCHGRKKHFLTPYEI